MRRLLWILLAVTACGGRVESDGRDVLEPGESPLGPCVVGAEPTGQPCPFFADGLCYPTKAAACNCACPRDRDSTCLSDLGGSAESTSFVQCN